VGIYNLLLTVWFFVQEKIKTMIAIYTFCSKGMLILIPKRRGEGYCKSVFGFHSSNKNCHLFDEIKPDWFVGDTCDIDGYLHLDLYLNSWDKRFEEGVQLTIEALKTIFPFVTEFKEDDNLFWEMALK